jgi:hypothetical protein
MNGRILALGMLLASALLGGCASPGGSSGFDREETIPPDKMYGQSFVAEAKVLYGVKFRVQGGKADAYLLRVNDFNGNPKNTESFKEHALAKDVESNNGALVAELVPGTYMLIFDNPRTETIRVSWSRQYNVVK